MNAPSSETCLFEARGQLDQEDEIDAEEWIDRAGKETMTPRKHSMVSIRLA